jgi:hypothetical protein
MQRSSPALTVQSAAPVTIESRALGTLAYIRASVDSSSSMDVPGMAGIVMGLIGVLAAILVSVPRWSGHWLGIWLSAAAVARLLGSALVARQYVRRGHTRYFGPARKFLLCLCPALFAGAVLTGISWTAGMTGIIPGMWLLLYGCAVLSASTVTIAGISRLIGVMGAAFVALGLITFILPGAARTVMLGLGFGVLHIVFGILIGRLAHGE